MSRDARLRRLEGGPGGGERVTFAIGVPPEHLSAAEHASWAAEQRRAAEVRGVYSFTLDLGAAVIP